MTRRTLRPFVTLFARQLYRDTFHYYYAAVVLNSLLILIATIVGFPHIIVSNLSNPLCNFVSRFLSFVWWRKDMKGYPWKHRKLKKKEMGYARTYVTSSHQEDVSLNWGIQSESVSSGLLRRE
jgi:hypothetical protein